MKVRIQRKLATAAIMATLCAGTVACGSGVREAGGEVVNGEWHPAAEGTVKGVALPDVAEAIRTRLDAGSRPADLSDGRWARVVAIYEGYEHAPLWFGRNGPHSRAATLMTALEETHTHALVATEYPLAELRQALTEADRRRPTAEAIAEADLHLTATYVLLAEDMLTGQIDAAEVSQEWHIRPRKADVDSAIVRVLRNGDLDASLSALTPTDPNYEFLREQLARYRELVAAGGWPRVPDGPSLRPRDTTTAERLQAITERLRIEGYLDGAAAPQQRARGDTTPVRAVYDERIAGAIATFQARHTIVVDSILGGETLESLNRPAEYRLGQLAANLERSRWLPRMLGSKYVLVNVPAFRLEAYDAGQTALEMKVIVGAEYDDKATPAFSDSMSYVVFRPYWNVPNNILERTIMPKVAEDPSYLERNNFEWVSDAGGERLRQRPGTNNSLGQVKFMFPNQFAIYLHDTPEPELFKQDVRAASHGCIRVENPVELAQFILGWDAGRVRDAMHSGPENSEVHLEQKVPVYIVYSTTYLRDGTLYFGNDIYDRDQQLVRRTMEKAMPNPEAQREIAALKKLAG